MELWFACDQPIEKHAHTHSLAHTHSQHTLTTSRVSRASGYTLCRRLLLRTIEVKMSFCLQPCFSVFHTDVHLSVPKWSKSSWSGEHWPPSPISFSGSTLHVVCIHICIYVCSYSSLSAHTCAQKRLHKNICNDINHVHTFSLSLSLSHTDAYTLLSNTLLALFIPMSKYRRRHAYSMYVFFFFVLSLSLSPSPSPLCFVFSFRTHSLAHIQMHTLLTYFYVARHSTLIH